MVTAGDRMAPYENGGAGEKFCKMQFLPDEGGNSGISELERMLKQVTLTRYIIQPVATMEDLPDEILSNIFIRLLARQLAQMRSVSKSWNGLLSDPSFVKSHLHRSIRNNNQQILLVFPGYNKPFTQYSCESRHIEPINFIKHIPTNLPMTTLIGAVNGLICLSDFSYSNIHIWNPSLSAVQTIPPPLFLPSTSRYISTSMRFGFDPKTNDYKLVKISGICNDDYFSVKECLEIEVYSMRKGSWEFISQHFPSHIKRISDTDYLCVDGHHGHLHWESKTGLLTSSAIVGFDLGSETFREIPLPDSLLDSNHISHHLRVLDGKLCEMSWRRDGRWEVWAMEEYGLPESWAIRHVFSQFNDEVCLYGFTSRNELLVQDMDGHLVLYDPVADNTKSTRTQQEVYRFMEYVDSLVWI